MINSTNECNAMTPTINAIVAMVHSQKPGAKHAYQNDELVLFVTLKKKIKKSSSHSSQSNR
jgi:hypothetical protein